MGLLDFFQLRNRRAGGSGSALLQRLRARLPEGGGPGLAPPPTQEEAEAERRLAERFAAELHAYGAREPLGLGRRAAAVVDAGRRRKAAELAEALEGLPPWQLPSLLEALEARQELDRPALLDTARALARQAESWEALAGALGIVGLDPGAEDRELLLQAGRSGALTGICAMSAEPLGAEALLELARVAEGLGRAMALERLGLACAEAPQHLAPLAAEALELAGSIGDAAARAYAAVPLLEVADGAALLEAQPALAGPVAACLEAAARGGWNGGPGPGLGRLPGAIRAAEALLRSEAPEAVRKRTASAVLESHPLPPGPVRQLAQQQVAVGQPAG